MAKILIVSHTPYSSSGYGRVVRGIAGSLNANGHQVVCLGAGPKPEVPEFPYPVIAWKKMSQQIIAQTLAKLRPEVLFTIGDPWMFEEVPAMPQRPTVIWLAYYPIDGSPLPGSWKRWAAAIDVPIVFSKFARDVVKAAADRAPDLIYHGVNTKTFSPTDREKSKELCHVAGHFVVGTVARNQLRKNIPALVKAFAKFARGKDDVLLYLHTQLKGEFDIAELVRNAGIEKKTRITGEIGTDKGVPDHLLATVYRAMDLFVLPTMAEGFGLPIMESQACGTPALVTDFSACPELVPDPIQRLKVKTTLTMNRNFEQAIVDVDDIVEKMELFYRDRARLTALGERCAEFAKSFEWDIAYRQFNDLLVSERVQELVASKRINYADSAPPKAAGPFSQMPIGTPPHVAESSRAGAIKSPPAPVDEKFEEIEKLHTAAISDLSSGKVLDAISKFQRVVDSRPNNPEFQNQLAIAFQAGGKIDDAIKHFRRSVELRPGRHQVWSNLAQAHLKAGDLAGARHACDAAMKLSPESAIAHEIKGTILLKSGNLAGAKWAFQNALSRQPGLTAATRHLAEVEAVEASNQAVPPVFASSRSGLSEENAREKFDEVAAAGAPYPNDFAGRGIVIVGGGLRYFPCAWVCIRMLRECGCKLPIELWHLGSEEMTVSMSDLVAQYDVACVDGQEKADQFGTGDLGGWELKPLAILRCRFQEVLLLDADNFPLMDPTFLFDTPKYKEHGAVFWSDYGRLKADDPIWEIAGVSYRDEPAFESGQILIDKARCWKPLQLTMWMNQNSDFWYRYLFGDKDTFHLAWRKLGQDYAMPARKVAHLEFGMGHHDFDGRRIFQHRNRAKWVLSGWNPITGDFEKEHRGFAFLEALRTIWKSESVEYNQAAAERLKSAWKAYVGGEQGAAKTLSDATIDPIAWGLIDDVVENLLRCINDTHTVHLIKKAIAAAPRVAELHAVLGATYGTMGQHRKAQEAFRIAFELSPETNLRQLINDNSASPNLSQSARALKDL